MNLPEQLVSKRAELAALFAQHRKGDGTYGFDPATLTEVRSRTEELEALQKQHDSAAELDRVAKVNDDALAQMRSVARPVFGGGTPQVDQKSTQPEDVGSVIAKGITDMRASGRKYGHFELAKHSFAPAFGEGVDFKTLFSESAGWAPEILRSGKVVLSAQEEPRVVDLYPKGTTGMAGYRYMKETTFTNNADATDEGGTYPEAALQLTETTQNVEKISVFIPVTDEQLEDVEGVRNYLTMRLQFMVAQELDQQLLSGTGVAPNLLGTLNLTSILTQAKGTDPNVDAVHKAITQIRVTGKAMANAILMHPNDWQDVRLLRTSIGEYIYGPPSMAVRPMIWGLPVVTSTFITENTVLVGDFANYSGLFIRRGISVEMSNSHSDWFVQGKQAVRVDMRCVLVHFRDQAFCKVTGF